jgi:hypothetical protein
MVRHAAIRVGCGSHRRFAVDIKGRVVLPPETNPWCVVCPGVTVDGHGDLPRFASASDDVRDGKAQRFRVKKLCCHTTITSGLRSRCAADLA